MPVQPTFPGVYIEEIPSGVRTIAGVPTSVTAFVGRALRGPVNEPTVVNGYGDFERIFGGLSLKSSMSYALRDYFLNGGGQAIIVRLFQGELFDTASDKLAGLNAFDAMVTQLQALADTAAGDALVALVAPIVDGAVTKALPGNRALFVEAAKLAKDAAKKTKKDVLDALKAPRDTALRQGPVRALLRVPGGEGLVLAAVSQGAWANLLRARVDHDVPAGVAERFGAASDTDFFNLTVRDMGTGTTEVFRNVTVGASTRRIDKVLENESTLVRAVLPLPTVKPTASSTDASKAPFSDERSVFVAATDLATDGRELTAATFTGPGLAGRKEGLFSLERTELFNLLCIPPHALDGTIEDSLLSEAMKYCEQRRAFMVVDPPSGWISKSKALEGFGGTDISTHSKNAALFFPRIVQPNPLRENQLETFVPCGAVAGVMARTDAQRGIWKAPAGLDATLTGVPQLAVSLTDAENGELNPKGINCLRTMPGTGRVVWGARTLQGDDRLASEWKYLPVRRMALFIEESLFRGTQWVVFESNDEPLWSQIRLNVGTFMNNLFRQGALQGKTPREAYFVKCDKETNTQADIDLGIVNILVGFAPLKPAEFVFIKLQQLAGQIAA